VSLGVASITPPVSAMPPLTFMSVAASVPITAAFIIICSSRFDPSARLAMRCRALLLPLTCSADSISGS